MFGFGKKEVKARGFEMQVVTGQSKAEAVLARSVERLARLQAKRARWVLKKKDYQSPAHRAHFDEIKAEIEMLEHQIKYCNGMLGVK